MEQREATPLRALARHPSLALETLWAWLTMGGGSRGAAGYRRWRLQTAYGGDNPRLLGSDLVHFLHWRRQMRRLRRWQGMT